MRVINEGTLRKREAGDLALPLSKLSSREGRIDLIDGSLSLTADASYERSGTLSAALQQKAAFWLDANTNVITFDTNDQLWVQQRLDVREPDPQGPFQHPRAVGKTITKTICRSSFRTVPSSPMALIGRTSYVFEGAEGVGSGRIPAILSSRWRAERVQGPVGSGFF